MINIDNYLWQMQRHNMHNQYSFFSYILTLKLKNFLQKWIFNLSMNKIAP